MNKQTVYIPNRVKEEQNELQKEIEYWYQQTGSLTSETIVKRAYSLGLGKGLICIQAYVFTPEELKQLLEEYTNRIVENVEFGQIENSKEYIECVESITNQLPLMLKELGI